MADGPRIKLLLRSTANTGYTYTTTKNRRTTAEKLELKKYDPVVRKHVSISRGENLMKTFMTFISVLLISFVSESSVTEILGCARVAQTAR